VRVGLAAAPGSGVGYHVTSGNSAIERLQAARHSGLLICVAASQKSMQASSDLPPPPGLLGDDSLPLLEDVPGDSARFGEEPPPVANWSGSGSDMGERAGSAGSGVAAAAGGVRAGRVGVGTGTEPPPLALAAELAAVEVLVGLLAARPPAAAAPAVPVVPTAALVPPPALPWAAGAANGVAVDGPGSIALAGAERTEERMLEPWEPPRASAIEADATSNRAMAAASCSLDVSMLTP
jgi:hypothetical protein